MTYLSRVWLNPRRTNAQRFLQDPRATHAIVLQGLARQPVTERVLWRLEPDSRSPYRLELLVLTESQPSWEHLIEQAGWPASSDGQATIRPYQPLLDQIARGRQFAFRLRANPSTATRHPDAPSGPQKEHLASDPRARGVRVPHRTAEHQLRWLTDRIQRWGFIPLTDEADLPMIRLVARERMSFRKPAVNSPVVLQAATFDGLLQIDDPHTAQQSLLNGVGKGKAYGLGLITLAPTSGTAT